MARTRVRAGDAEVLREAKARFERCVAYETTARSNALSDARFANGDAINGYQWDPAVRASRGDRPMLTMNKTRQHNLQIVNDARQHKAQIKVTPTGNEATYEAAQIFSGIIRRIEYQSKAIDAYSTAIYHQVETGIGYCRVVTDFADEQSFDQEIYIRRVRDPRTIYLDPDAADYDKADMRFAFVFDDVPRDQYEAEHGKGDMAKPAALDHTDGWNDHDHVRVAEYWRRNDATDTLHLLIDGTSKRESDMEPGELAALKGAIVKSRPISEPEVEWFKICGDRIDERKVWPGRYIPIVPFIGEETVIDGVMDRKGHTRCLIDPQRMYNYWGSSAVEHVALQGKMPYIGAAEAIEGYDQYWKNANTVNYSVLVYNGRDDQGRPIERPERAQPPTMAQAYIEGMNIAREDMMMVSGQYQAQMGAPGNEISGAAIGQRQRQSENAVAHYTDNQAKGIRQIGRILLDLIPKIYDTARVVKIMALDGTDSDIALVPSASQAHQHVAMGPQGPQPITPEQADEMRENDDMPDPKVIFNPNVGRYDVEADVGPSYGTQREEAFNAFSQILSQNQAAFPIVGDFWAANADFPGADELAERLKRGLPPQYRAGPDPQVAQIQQAMQQQGQQAQQLLQKADAEVASLKAEIMRLQEQAEEKAYDSETKRLAAVGAIDPDSLKLLIREMVSQMIGMPALPVMAQHAAAEQAMLPPEPMLAQ